MLPFPKLLVSELVLKSPFPKLLELALENLMVMHQEFELVSALA
jgi:hypothetical protein